MTASRNAGSGLYSASISKKPHLLRNAGLPAEVADVRADMMAGAAALAAIAVEEFIDAPIADTNAFKTSIASSTSAAVYSGAALNGVVGVASMVIPRNVTVTVGGTIANAPATALITGLFKGAVQTETLSGLTSGGTIAGTKPFDSVTSISLPAGAGTAATLEFGFGAGIGVQNLPKSRAGLLKPVREIEGGVAVTTGLLTTTQLYTPGTPPDGSTDYAIYYEYVAQ